MDWCWSWNSNTLATWCEELTHWKRPWCWERLRAGGEGDDTGWDGWMASSTQRTWVWVDSGSWWWTGRPGVLRFMGSQRVGHNWATELNWTEEQQGRLLSASAEIGHCTAAAADLHHLLREAQVGGWGTLCSWETGGTGLYSARYFQKLISWSQSLHLFISRKSLNHFMVTSGPVTSRKTFCKISAWLHWALRSPKSFVFTFPHSSLEQFLRANWGAISRAAVLILPQMKLNSQLSCCASFLVDIF